MIQFYFLSIFCNALTGYILISSGEKQGNSIADDFRLPVHNETFRLILGVLTMVTGLLKILSATTGDVPVIGDLIPAAAGFLAGFILVYEFYRERSELPPEQTEKLENLLIKNKRIAGFVALAAAALHFLFPTVLLL